MKGGYKPRFRLANEPVSFITMKKETCVKEDKRGNLINTCDDKPVITFCKKCNCLYKVNGNSRDELSLTLKELLDFIDKYEADAPDMQEVEE